MSLRLTMNHRKHKAQNQAQETPFVWLIPSDFPQNRDYY